MKKERNLNFISIKMLFIFIVLLGIQYVLLDLYSIRLFEFQENLLKAKTLNAKHILEVVAIIIGLLLVNFLAQFASIRFGRKKMQIQNDMVKKYLKLPFVYYYDVNYGQVLDSLQSYPGFFMNDVFKIYKLSFNAIICILIFIKLFSISVILSVLSLGLLFVFFFIDRFFLKLVRKADKLRVQLAPALYNGMGDSLSGRLDIRSVGANEYFEKRIFPKIDSLSNNFFKRKEGLVITRGNLEVIIQKVLPIFSLLIALFIFKDSTVTNAIMPFYMLFILLPNPLSVLSIFEHIKTAKTMTEPIEKLFKAKEAQDGSEAFTNDNITVNSLTVNLRDNTLLDNVTVKIKKGEKVLIIGDSGSGKSVFLNCLMGIDYQQSGSVNYGRTEVKKIKRDDFLQKNSFLDLKGLVLDGTLRDNLLLSTSATISDEELTGFIDSIGVANFIPFLKDLDKVLNPDTLSDGEAVTVSLLRELIKRPTVFFLDETFSSLDVAVEECFFKYLMSIDSTVIMISHNQAHVKYFERLIYFKDKNICLYTNAKEALENPLVKNFYASTHEYAQKGENQWKLFTRYISNITKI